MTTPPPTFAVGPILARIRGPVEALCRAQAEELATAARDLAPVRTGAYRASLRAVRVDVADPDVIAYTVAGAPYARFIYSSRRGSQKSGRPRWVLTRDLGDPTRAGRVARARDVARVAGEAMRG